MEADSSPGQSFWKTASNPIKFSSHLHGQRTALVSTLPSSPTSRPLPQQQQRVMQQMRTLTESDVEKLPLTGLVYAHVEVHGRGDLPTRKVEKRYVRNAAHLVLQFGEEIIQPLSKELVSARDASVVAPVELFAWWQMGNVSLLTGGPLGFSGAKPNQTTVPTSSSAPQEQDDGHPHRW